MYGEPFALVLAVRELHGEAQIARSLRAESPTQHDGRDADGRSHQRRLCILPELVLLGALRDVLARLEGAGLSAEMGLADTLAFARACTHRPKNADMVSGVVAGEEGQGRHHVCRAMASESAGSQTIAALRLLRARVCKLGLGVLSSSLPGKSRSRGFQPSQLNANV